MYSTTQLQFKFKLNANYEVRGLHKQHFHDQQNIEEGSNSLIALKLCSKNRPLHYKVQMINHYVSEMP